MRGEGVGLAPEQTGTCFRLTSLPFLGTSLAGPVMSGSTIGERAQGPESCSGKRNYRALPRRLLYFGDSLTAFED